MLGANFLEYTGIVRDSSHTPPDVSIDGMDKLIERIGQAVPVDEQLLALARSFIAMLYEEKGLFDKALTIYRGLLNFAYRNGTIVFNYARVLDKTSKKDEAVNAIDFFLKEGGGSSQERLNLISLGLSIEKAEADREKAYRAYFADILSFFGLPASNVDNLARSVSDLEKNVHDEARHYAAILRMPKEKQKEAAVTFLNYTKIPYFRKLASERIDK